MQTGAGRVVAVSVLAFLISAADHAWAVDRSGFIIGVGVGGGRITCDGCESLDGPAVEFHVGGMLNESSAIVLDGNVVAKSEGDDTLYSIVNTAAIQYWLSDAAWVKGGIGFGVLQIDFGGGGSLSSDEGLGFTAAAGFEIIQMTKVAIDLQARYSTAKIEGGRVNNLSLVLGFNLY
jgi:hypothetical protein